MSDTTKPGHTIGPWVMEDGNLIARQPNGDMVLGIIYDVEEMSCLCEDDDEYEEVREEMEANRTLITASPDQNAALKRVAAALVASSHSEKYVSEDDWNPDAHVEIVLTIADARAVYAAIAKAEGKGTDAS